MDRFAATQTAQAARCCCDPADSVVGRLPGARPPLRWWLPAAVFAAAALVLTRTRAHRWTPLAGRQGHERFPVADIACVARCLLPIPLTRLAPRLAEHVAPDILTQVARDTVTYVRPTYLDALPSLLAEDDRTVLPDRLSALLGPTVDVVRLPRDRPPSRRAAVPDRGRHHRAVHLTRPAGAPP